MTSRSKVNKRVRARILKLASFKSQRDIGEHVLRAPSTVGHVIRRATAPATKTRIPPEIRYAVEVRRAVEELLNDRKRVKRGPRRSSKVTAVQVHQKLPHVSLRTIQLVMKEHDLYLKRGRDPEFKMDTSYVRTESEERNYQRSQRFW
jgi:hypothetical protein